MSKDRLVGAMELAEAEMWSEANKAMIKESEEGLFGRALTKEERTKFCELADKREEILKELLGFIVNIIIPDPKRLKVCPRPKRSERKKE